MSIESRDPRKIAEYGATSLFRERTVNGLGYHGCTYEVVADEDVKIPENIAPTMVMYYPAQGITKEPFAEVIKLGSGDLIEDGALRAMVGISDNKAMMQQFISFPGIATVVDFIRQPLPDGVSRIEVRNSLLRKHRAPLAALAIRANERAYQAVLLTPSMVWPWMASAEMKQFIEEN